MKQSLLSMVQNILSAMDSDNVNSIDDTIEAIQVALIVKECFEDLMSQRDWPFLQSLSALDGLGDVARPTTMSIPEDVNKVYWIRYNKKEVCYMDPASFKHMIDLRVEQTGVVDSDGWIINRDPLYWTTFNDTEIVFDSYNSDNEATLQTSNNEIFVLNVAEWTHEDDFVPAIPEHFFPTLLAEAKATAFINLKQQANNREERRAQRGRVMLRGRVNKATEGTPKYNEKVNYGR